MLISLVFAAALAGAAPEIPPEASKPKGGALCAAARPSPAMRSRGAAVRCAAPRNAASKAGRGAK